MKDGAGRTLATLAGIVFLRVAGVSLVLAGFVDHALALGGDVRGAGLAFAAYPLALAALMLPLAAASDRLGRRPVLVGGLAVAAVGAAMCAWAPSLAWLGVGRLVQGAGAINGVALAAAGETGAPDRRARRMAALGAAAGGGFAVGLVLGALLLPLVGMRALFLVQAAASLLLVPAVLRTVPRAAPPAPLARARGAPAAVLALGGASFALSLSMTGLLFLSPLLLEGAAWPYAALVTLMVLPGGLGMFLAARLADCGRAREVGLASAALLALSPLAFVLDAAVWLVLAAGILFFVGHSSLSALLPALAQDAAHPERRGAAQGVQSTAQYLGSAAGAAVAAALWPSGALLAALFLAAGALVAAGVARAAS